LQLGSLSDVKSCSFVRNAILQCDFNGRISIYTFSRRLSRSFPSSSLSVAADKSLIRICINKFHLDGILFEQRIYGRNLFNFIDMTLLFCISTRKLSLSMTFNSISQRNARVCLRKQASSKCNLVRCETYGLHFVSNQKSNSITQFIIWDFILFSVAAAAATIRCGSSNRKDVFGLILRSIIVVVLHNRKGQKLNKLPRLNHKQHFMYNSFSFSRRINDGKNGHERRPRRENVEVRHNYDKLI